MKALVQCKRCLGFGTALRGLEYVTCPDCQGYGEIETEDKE